MLRLINRIKARLGRLPRRRPLPPRPKLMPTVGALVDHYSWGTILTALEHHAALELNYGLAGDLKRTRDLHHRRPHLISINGGLP